MTTPPSAAENPESQQRPLGQVAAVLGVLIQPGRTLARLPSDRTYALAFLAPIYFGFVRLIDRTGWEYYLFKLLLVAVAALFAVPASAWLVRQFLKLFGKRLTTAKLMNLGGYVLVPQLVFAVVVTLGAVALGGYNNDTLFLVIAGAAVLVVLYSLGLYIYGIIVSPSDAATPAREAT